MAATRRPLDGPRLAREFAVEFEDEDVTKMLVNLSGPKDSLYSGYRFKVKVELDEDYPRKPPLVHFVTKIYHPNVDYDSGFPCVSALDNENWNGDSRLENIFKYVLPQLLCRPNFKDPYNDDASDLRRQSVEEYEEKVKAMCELHAEKE